MSKRSNKMKTFAAKPTRRKLAAELAQATSKARMAEADVARLTKTDNFARSVMIAVECEAERFARYSSESGRGRISPYDAYQVSVTFHPDAYVRHTGQLGQAVGPASYMAVQNVSEMSERIGYEIGRMVAKKIFERFTSPIGGPR